jgi:hypothetical protein
METAPLPTAETMPPKPRWFHSTPARLLVVLLAVEGLLLLLKPWFPKGWAVLIAIAVVGITMVLMLIWWLAALLFHWRFQFSLRSLLVATVVVAIPFSWLAVEMKRAREQREVVEAIRKLGGVGYFHELYTPFPEMPGPVWLQKCLGTDFFADVFQVALHGTQVTDATLEHISGLTRLQFLFIDDTEVTDAGLVHLHGLRQLKILVLHHTQVTGQPGRPKYRRSGVALFNRRDFHSNTKRMPISPCSFP